MEMTWYISSCFFDKTEVDRQIGILCALKLSAPCSPGKFWMVLQCKCNILNVETQSSISFSLHFSVIKLILESKIIRFKPFITR